MTIICIFVIRLHVFLYLKALKSALHCFSLLKQFVLVFNLIINSFVQYLLVFQGYTNADNPFGDEHLLDTFVWQKKLEKEGKSDLGKAELEKIQQSKMVESKVSFTFFNRYPWHAKVLALSRLVRGCRLDCTMSFCWH